MLEKTQNSACDFAEELVSYLYNEMSGADKLHFESHLKDCSPCQDELAGFSLARTSIQEWRDEEFLPLQNPAIEIPYPNKAQQFKSESVSRSWFASVRALFTLSPAWTTASTALAALAICVGLFVILFNSMPNDDEVVVQTDKNVKVVSSPTTGNQNKNSNVSNANQNRQKPNNSSEPSVTNNSPKPSSSVVEPTKIVAPPEVVKPNNLTVKKPVQPKTTDKRVNSPVKSKKQKAPSFLEEDEDDDSLTLTDLLEQIGTKETDD